MKFKATILQTGKSATGIVVPDEIVTGLGSSKRPAVTVTINGHSYRSTITPMGGDYMLPFSSEHRAATGLGGGDEVEVEVVLDTEPRGLAIPEDLQAALDAVPDVKAIFDKLSYSNKQRHVLSILDAKTPETRQRRVEKAITSLRA